MVKEVAKQFQSDGLQPTWSRVVRDKAVSRQSSNQSWEQYHAVGVESADVGQYDPDGHSVATRVVSQ